MRATALLLLTSVAIVGFGPSSSEAGAGTDGSRQIVIEDKDAKKAEPAEEKVKDEPPAKAEVRKEIEKDEAAKDEDEAPAKADAKEEDDEAEPAKNEDEPADIIVKEDERKPAEIIVKEEVGKPEKDKEEVIIKEVIKEEPPLVVVLQTELKRVGCYHGKVDGDWGPGSSEALADFYHYGKVSSSKFDPTPDALALVKGKKGVVCLAHDRPQDDYGEYDSDGGYGGGGGYSDGY